MRTVSGTIQLKVRGQLVQIDLSIPDGRVQPPAMVPAFQLMSDALVGHAIRQSEAEGNSISCRAGCWACCRHLIPVTEGEARYLAELVNTMPEPRRTAVRRRFQETLETLREKDILTALRDPEKPGAPSLHDLGMVYFANHIPCPFLEETRCSIHPHRPLACREHLVTSPPANCDKPTAASISKLPMPASVFGALITLGRTAAAERTPFVPLVLALEWAERNPDKTAAVSGRELLRQAVENLAGKPLER